MSTADFMGSQAAVHEVQEKWRKKHGSEDAGLIGYNSKLVGVTFEGRQEVIAMLDGSEKLRFRREADNQYDKNAVAVDVEVAETWHPIGYIAKDKNSELAAQLDAGKEPTIEMSGPPTGGGDRSYGVNVLITISSDDETQNVRSTAKDGSKVNSEYKAQSSESKHLTNDTAIVNAIKELLGVETKTVKYSSRILGKSIMVQETNGHITVPGYMSGSKFPQQFIEEFPKKMILEAMAKKGGVDEDVIQKMWDISGDASTGYGSGVHAALEVYDTYYKLGEKLRTVKKYKTKPDVYGPNKALSKNVFLKKIVEDFHEKFGGDYVRFSEQFIWHKEKGLCGAIDRLKVVDANKKIVRIQDFKTNGNIHDEEKQKSDSPFKGVVEDTKLGAYWLQLSFYAYILGLYGYTVEGLDIYWLNPEKLIKGENAWEEYSREVVNIEGVM